MNIGFWNIDLNKKKEKKSTKDFSDSLVSFAREQDLDILCLAESNENTQLSFLTKINVSGIITPYHQVKTYKDRISIFSRLSNFIFDDMSHLYNSNRWTIVNISIPHIFTCNLVVVHFDSKSDWSNASLSLECVNLAKDIATIEQATKCSDTILIGDFNMDPFEDGLVAANGINALASLDHALKKPKGREVNRTFYPYFYNPMWNFFGDFSEPYGTYYYRTPRHISHEWHIFDQIIIRPSLKPYLHKDFVKIIHKIYNENLTKNFLRPDNVNYSDHLPITLKLKL